jgi:16S rRNA (guanine527-N7)-methyltransferase
MGSVVPAFHPPMPFPDADWNWFSARCAQLGLPLDAAKRPVLEALHGHLSGVNRWLNLTRIDGPRDYLKLHILDSILPLQDSRLRHLAAGAPCIDLGSGGGYPGLPLALWCPAAPWVLADARARKAAFLAAAGPLVGPHVSAVHLRGGEVARSAPTLRRSAQLVVSRAMGPGAEVLDEAAGLLRKHGHLLLYKGPAFSGPERDAALLRCCERGGWRLVNEHRARLDEADPERVVVVFERIG